MPQNSSQKQISRIRAGSFFYRHFVCEREASAPRGVCVGCTGYSVISVQRWFDNVTPRSSAGLRNVIHVLSARFFVHVARWSMFWSRLSLSLRSVQPLSRKERTAPHTSRSVPEDKCEDDPDMMLPLRMAVCSALWDAVVFSGSLFESSLVEKKGITSAVWRRPLLWFSAERKRIDTLLLDVSWHMTNVADGSTSQYFALTSDNVRLDP